MEQSYNHQSINQVTKKVQIHVTRVYQSMTMQGTKIQNDHMRTMLTNNNKNNNTTKVLV